MHNSYIIQCPIDVCAIGNASCKNFYIIGNPLKFSRPLSTIRKSHLANCKTSTASFQRMLCMRNPPVSLFISHKVIKNINIDYDQRCFAFIPANIYIYYKKLLYYRGPRGACLLPVCILCTYGIWCNIAASTDDIRPHCRIK